jgi:hypothetical protein
MKLLSLLLHNHGNPPCGPLQKREEGPGERELLLLAWARSCDPARLSGLVPSIGHQQAHRVAGPFSFRREVANQAQNELKGFVPRGASLRQHAPMTQNPCLKADSYDTTAPSAHRGLL